MISTQPWYIDSSIHHTLQQSPQKASTYTLLEGGKGDYQKVVTLYQKSPLPGYGVGRIEIINNPALTRQFEGKVMVLNARGNNVAFKPKWGAESDLSVRTRIDQALKEITIQHPSTYQHVQFLPMFHGTKATLVDSIFQTGFANLATTDSGFFGKGIYNTSYAEYAHRVYSDGTILFNWVAFFSAYPVTHPDMSKLQGGSNYSNYDAHYTLIVPRNPDNPNEVVYFPLTDTQDPTYDELVVFDSSHVLPRYLVTLTPEGPNLKPIGVQATGLTLMMAIGTYFPQVDAHLQPLLQQQITLLSSHLNTALTQDQLFLLRIIERSQTETDTSIKMTLASRVTKLLDAASTEKIIVPQQTTIVSQKTISLPPLAFGKADWEKYFGEVGIEPPLPPNIHDILESSCPFWPAKKVKETHLLVLIPQTVNGKALTLDYLEQLIQKPLGGGHATKYGYYHEPVKKEHGGKPAGQSHWVLMTTDVIPTSRGKFYGQQQELVRKYAHYQIPQTLEAAACILMEHVKEGKRLYPRDPWTFTRCQEQTAGLQNVVGGFGPSGLYVHTTTSATTRGVGALRKF